ncbi:hypothetical protein [Clostridium folliculivorans]|uniref:Uncharacterized protein n=1 Tax=Clostridium folliculivorans TaxID=2886038 RepID=A0A9W5Y0V6_9CLOT|nr:hypothetical protein [Clostridium folliculivorans]GKU24548.1 hypothetical protein CFOLD11_13740 [Clostridium folliculivorans]GKU30646.1 hypothetical protein CFB3_27530 [Clostridium folliculivorans]
MSELLELNDFFRITNRLISTQCSPLVLKEVTNRPTGTINIVSVGLLMI